MSEGYETVEKLLGDFFERNTAGDKDGVKAVVSEIDGKIRSGELDSEPFKDYFNNMYAGRGAINMAGLAADYPRESIIRELLQNVFGCDYDEPNIKVMIEFLDEGQVKLTYNETGFRLEQVFYYLSVGRNDGDRKREGRFGLGAKSVFTNVDWFKMRSNTYSLRVVNDEGTLKVRELELNGKQFNHTEIIFALPEDEQKALHENLITLTSKKGLYINMVDLCFAFIRKKNLTSTDEEECADRAFNIAIINYGKPEVVYKINHHQRSPEDIRKVRFSENGKSVADFISAEYDGFTYLVPYAISGAKVEAGKVLMSKYNYFSTFELTGFVKADKQEFVDEKLSAFFVSVPNKYITNNRSGIKYDSLEKCAEKIEQGILAVADEYKRLFVLDFQANPNLEGYYMLSPKQYVFKFFYNYVNTSKIAKGLREKFGNSVSVLFPDSDNPVLFEEIRKTGFFSERSGVSKEEHEDGSARKALEQDIEQMDSWYGKDGNRAFVAKYRWNVPGTDEGGGEYLYKIYKDGKEYLMASDGGKKVKDYELGAGFKSIISLKLDDCIKGGMVENEDALADAFAVIDEMFGEDYRIAMKYFQFVITSGTATIQFEISKINIRNLKKAYDVLSAHEMRFENHQIFNQVVTLMVNSFTIGKDTVTFLKEIKRQGGEISLTLDINKRYRFSVYGKQFMIPPNITNSDLLEIVGDVYSIIDSGMFNNRVFDFSYSTGRFAFDTQDILDTLPECKSAQAVEQMIAKMFVCDLGLDKIALLDSSDKLIKIVSTDAPIAPADAEKTAKYVVLRDGLTKAKYACFVEFLLTGENNNLLHNLYSGTEDPNLILIDQEPYYFKPVPTIKHKEFEYMLEQVRRIAPYEKLNQRAYGYYFARDINARLYGYGGVCPCCGYQTGVLNSFMVKPFSIGIIDGDKEKKFRFSLYLCRNDAAAAAGWLIEDISIGGMSPFLWLEELKELDDIPPEFLYVRLKYRKQVSYDVCEPDKKGNTMLETVYDGAPETFDVVLTPMMAAKWFEDNTNPHPAAPVQAVEEKPAEKPAETPAEKPAEKHIPATEPMSKDIGNIQM